MKCPTELSEVSRERWPDGTEVVSCAIPFPYRRKPPVPANTPSHVGLVPLDRVFASQRTVVAHGLREKNYGKPLVYAEPDGTFTIGDGHHRLTRAKLRGQKAVRARIVKVS